MQSTPKTVGLWPALTAAAVIVFMAACSGNYGRLQYDREVGHAFQSLQLHQDYHFYYRGRINLPSAIVGIDPAFELKSRLWAPIEPGRFKVMVDRMAISNYGILGGAYIIAPDGRRAGVWFSPITTVSVRFERNQIIIAFPDPSVRGRG